MVGSNGTTAGVYKEKALVSTTSTGTVLKKEISKDHCSIVEETSGKHRSINKEATGEHHPNPPVQRMYECKNDINCLTYNIL